MPWAISYDSEHDAISLEYSGLVTPAELRAAVAGAVAAGQQHGTWRCLTDCSQLIGGHTVVDLYQLVELLATAGVDQELREAVVMPREREAAAAAEFWETACRNRGLQVRLFPDRASALDWLLSPA